MWIWWTGTAFPETKLIPKQLKNIFKALKLEKQDIDEIIVHFLKISWPITFGINGHTLCWN